MYNDSRIGEGKQEWSSRISRFEHRRMTPRDAVAFLQTVQAHLFFRPHTGVFKNGLIVVCAQQAPQALNEIAKRRMIDDGSARRMLHAKESHGLPFGETSFGIGED